jgi:gamma-glutamyltranspeptidase / glutathione hydrolase
VREVIRMRVVAVFLALLLVGASGPGGRHVAVGRQAMVATEEHYATQVGVDVMRDGGNAVDAAVAVAYALAVVDPCCGNIGGGGFMLVRMKDGRERFIDFRETAPGKATRGMFLDANGNAVPERSRKGWLAIGVPGTVLGMETARREFGTMSRHALMAPAIALARDGFVIQKGDLLTFRGDPSQGYGSADFSGQPNARAIFMPRGRFAEPGETLRQPQLARTLQQIDRGGAAAFYTGPIAQAVVAASKANGGILTTSDFRNYRVKEEAPLHCRYHGYDIASAPPPSSGGVTLCEILNIIAPYPLASWGWHTAKSLHYVTEAERRAYADRNTYLGDPAFVKNPIAQLLSPAYAAKLRAGIASDRATPSVDVKPGLGAIAHENDDTTHFSIVDPYGNAAAVTFTLNDWFGAGVIAGDTGFFLNDEMDDFTAKPGVPNMFGLVQGERNDVRPGKRPLSSMTPSILTKNGKLAMVTGSPGGSRITTIVLETILNSLVYGMNAQQSVDAARTHMQWLPDQLQYQPGAFAPATAKSLAAMGYTLREILSWGSAQVVVVDPKTGVRCGGSDWRRPAGEALGY